MQKLLVNGRKIVNTENNGRKKSKRDGQESASVSLCMYHSEGICVCECVCLSVCHYQFVSLGLFMCMLIWYLGFKGVFVWVFFGFFLDCLVGCLSMIVWTLVLGVLYACVLYFHLFSAVEHVSY